jgi:hypothetical protein
MAATNGLIPTTFIALRSADVGSYSHNGHELRPSNVTGYVGIKHK